MADIENMRASVQTLPCVMPELEANIKVCFSFASAICALLESTFVDD